MSAIDTDHTGTADTQLMRAVRDTIPSNPPSDRPSRVEIERDQGERTAEERQQLDDRRWRILADRLSDLSAANEVLANRALKRDRWEVAMADMAARQNNALTILLARSTSIKSEELAKKVVLVVEDDEHLLPLMRTMLAGAGATVFYERTALDARLRLERIGPENLSCAVIDVHLQDGNGISLAHDMRHRSPQCGVVLTSGYETTEFDGEADRNGFALLDKPFDPRALIDSVLAAMELQVLRCA